MRAMGFYEIQDQRIRAWNARDAGKENEPLFTAREWLELDAEVVRVRGLLVFIQKTVEEATPAVALPSEGETKEGSR